MIASPQRQPVTHAGPPRLSFQVRGAVAERHCAVPTLSFALGIEREGGGSVRSLLLDVQIQIAARRRSHDEVEQAALIELFGSPERWGQTLRTLPWTRTTIVVPPFETAADVSLPVACSYDLEASAPSYLSGLREGEVPLEFLFSGSAFYVGEGGMLQTARIPLDQEAGYGLPVARWREAMDCHFPGAAWVRLDRRAFDRLRAYKAANLCRTFDEAVQRLLEEV